MTRSGRPEGRQRTYFFLAAFLAAFLAGAFLAAFLAGAFLAAFLAAFFTGALEALAGLDFAGAFAAAIGIVLVLASRSSVKTSIPLLVELVRQKPRCFLQTVSALDDEKQTKGDTVEFTTALVNKPILDVTRHGLQRPKLGRCSGCSTRAV